MLSNPTFVSIRVHKKATSSGFTLLELLIAISLSTLLMTVLVVGLNQITRDWERSGGALDSRIDDSLLLLQIEKAILGTFAYNYKENPTAQKQLFFEGTKKGMKWVSTVSPDRSGGLTLWQVKTNEEQGLQLVTMPAYPGDLNKQLQRFEQSQENIPVYFKDYKIDIHYLAENTEHKKVWSTNWLAEDKKNLPLGIRLAFKKVDEGENQYAFEVFSFIAVGSGSSSTVQMPFGFGGGGTSLTTPAAGTGETRPAASNPFMELLK